MVRPIAATLAAVAALSLAACGSSDSSDSSAKSAVTPEAAKARIERAAHVDLAAEPVPAEARKEGLRASYSNAATAIKDRQIVGLFVMKSENMTDKVADKVRDTAPKSAKLIVNGTVLVVYGSAGADRGAAVERAVKAL